MNTPSKINQPLDRPTFQQMGVDKFAGLTFATYGEAAEFSKAVAHAKYGLPEFLRGNVADCLILCTQALRWRLEPVWVMQQAYVAKGGGIISFNSFLFSAVLNASGMLSTRPRYTFVGQGDQRICTVSAVFKGETEPHSYSTPPLKTCRRNSPLWVSDPDQQLAYYAIRAFARRYVPELLGGVYDREEADEMAVAKQGGNATPIKDIKTINQGLDEIFKEEPKPEPEWLKQAKEDMAADDGLDGEFEDSDFPGDKPVAKP